MAGRWIRRLIILLFIVIPQLSYAQQDVVVPVFEPSYIHNFSDDQAGPGLKFKNFFEGKDGRIWLDPYYNENLLLAFHLFELDGYDFLPVEMKDQDISGAISFLVGMTEQNEIIGYNSRNFVFLFDLQTKKIKKFDFKPFLPEGKIKNVVLARDGNLLVLAADDRFMKLYTIQGDQIKQLVQLPYKTERQIFTSWSIKKFPLLENDQGIWLMGHKLPLYNYDPETAQIRAFDLDEEDKNSLKLEKGLSTKSESQMLDFEEGIKLFFPAYGHKLYNFSYKTGKIQAENNYPLEWEPQYLASDKTGNILVLFKDQELKYRAYLEGRLGQRYDYSSVARIGGTDDILHVKSTDFTKQVIINREFSLISAAISVRASVGLTTFSGNQPYVLPLHISDDSFLKQDPGRPLHYLRGNQLLPIPKDSISKHCALQYLQNGIIKEAIEVPSGKIWLIHRIDSGGIVGLNYQDESCENFPMEVLPFKIAGLNDSTLILLRSKGLSYFDTRSGKEKTVIDEPMLTDVSSFVFSLLLDSQKKLWVAAHTGLLRIDLQERTQKLMGEQDGLQDFRFHDIYEGENGIIYLGSVSRGVHIYDPATELVKVIDANMGLANNSVRTILQDEEGYLWVGTKDGLSLISPEGEVVRNFFKEDGLLSNEFILNSGYREKNGRLLFSTVNGLVVIDPKLIGKEVHRQSVEKPVLTELSYFDTQREKELVVRILDGEPRSIMLPAAHRYLKLKFALPNLIQPTANRFSYMLEGKDKDWNYLATQHELNLSRLPAGKYRLLIKGRDYLNNWSEEPLAIHIHAREFFFKQTWFYALCGMVLIGVAALWILRLRFEKQQLEQEVDERTREIRQDKSMIEQQANKLQRANDMQSRFFTNISHELRTPLTLISTPIEQILQKKQDKLSPKILRSLGMVRSNTQKLNGLVEEILELSKLEMGKVQLQSTPIAINNFIQQLFSAYESQANLKNINYTMHSDIPQDMVFLLDRGRLAKIINNLLSNALKFTPLNRSVYLVIKAEVEAEKTDTDGDFYCLSFSVKDTGPGIHSEDQPYVFDRYFQTAKPGVLSEVGTGIGLALSKELARLMGGGLHLESKWGSGSTFTLQLEGVKKLPEMTEFPVETRETFEFPTFLPSRKNNGGLSQILIVEDNSDMQELILSLLEDYYDCRVAHNGVEAWTMLQQKEEREKIQLIISDVMMPEMDGYSLLERIKGVPDLQTIPIIMLTARTAERDKLRALRLGVDDYLGKPFSADELLVRIANLLQRYKLRLKYQSEEPKEKEEATLPSANRKWLQEMEQIILEAIDKKIEINVLYLTHCMNVGDRQMLRRLKSLTGLTTNQYIQEIKLQHARRLLEEQVFLTVSEVAYASGFSTPAYFSKVYGKRFGKRPSKYFESLS